MGTSSHLITRSFSCGAEEDDGTIPWGNSGNSANPFTCDAADFSACGGDVVGTWEAVDLCKTADEMTESEPFGEDVACATSLITTNTSDLKATLVFTDSNITRTMSSTVSLSLNIAKGCIDVETDNEATVEQFCTQLATELRTSEEPVENLTCTATADACTCTGSQALNMSVQGTYTTATNTLTADEVEDGDSITTVLNYCVKDGHIILNDTEEEGEFQIYKKL